MDGLTISVEGEGEGAAAAKTAQATSVAPAPKTAGDVTILTDRSASVVDARGRLIKVKKITASERMRLFKVAGVEASQIDRYMGYAFLAASATEIAGAHMDFPGTELILQSNVDRLDEDGLAAVAKAVAALNPDREDVAAAAQNL